MRILANIIIITIVFLFRIKIRNIFLGLVMSIQDKYKSLHPSLKFYQDKYLKYDSHQVENPNLDIWYTKYLKYKKNSRI